MVEIWIETIEGQWFAVAYSGDRLAATAVAATRGAAQRSILRCLPSSLPSQFAPKGNPYCRDMIHLLSRLEAGDERNKEFQLSESDLPVYLCKLVRAAASIPIGYVTTYGRLAAIAGVPSRTVGRTMATNPFYPIVPCHRVVGANLSLVGYGGRQDEEALRSKLARLKAEARGKLPAEREVEGGSLALFPVELAILKGERELRLPGAQKGLFE